MTEYQLPEPAGIVISHNGYRSVRWSVQARILTTIYTADQLREEVTKAELRGREAALLPLIDRLVVLHIYRKEHETDTALSIKEMIDYEIQIALDPQVSSDAQALIDRGFADGKKAVHEAMQEIAKAELRCCGHTKAKELLK
jgi:hypothetical protein